MVPHITRLAMVFESTLSTTNHQFLNVVISQLAQTLIPEPIFARSPFHVHLHQCSVPYVLVFSTLHQATAPDFRR